MGQLDLDFTMPGLSFKKDDPTPKPETAKDGAAAKPEDKKDETKKSEAAPKAQTKTEAAPKAEEKKKEAAAKPDEKKTEAAPKAEEKKKEAAAKPAEKKKEAAPKADEKKTDGSDDILAPPPGTTISKFPKVEPQKNGIRDLCLSLFGLREAKIKQVTVNCQTDKGATNWRLDTTDSEDWPLVVRRSGTDIAADLFIEPPPGDCHQKNFTITVMYEDGQAGNATVIAQEHTDPKLAVDPKKPAIPLLDTWLYLTGDEKLFGKLEGIGSEALRLTTPWQDHLEVPLNRVVGVQIGVLDRKESPESFAKRLKTRGSDDLLLAADEKRRGHRDSGHPGRRRRRQAAVSLPG